MKKPIRRNQVFSGRLANALRTYVKQDEQRLAGEFWHSDAVVTAIENADNAIKSLQVLKKHLPKRFQPFIRFAQPSKTWYLNVEKGIIATQLDMLLDELLLRIARDIGYAPRLRIGVQPSHYHWKRSGFPLDFPERVIIPLPDEEEADKIIAEFLAKRRP